MSVMGNIWGEELVGRQMDNLVPQILTAVPFYAGSRMPMRVALACVNNFFLYAAQSAKPHFLHSNEDDSSLFSRLEHLYVVPDGDSAVVEKGALMLCLIMLQDHLQDMERDRLEGKYNPLASGAWNYQEIREQIMVRWRSIPETGIDREFPLALVEGQGYWRRN